MNIKLVQEGDVIRVTCPYSPEFIQAARQLGGKFAAGVWTFSTRHNGVVRAALNTVFGTDGTEEAIPNVYLHVRLDRLRNIGSELRVAGVTWIRKMNRDVAPQVTSPAAIVAGRLLERGGSTKYPEITFVPGTVLEVPVPRRLAEKLVAECPAAYSISS